MSSSGDAVDGILAAWALERPDVDVSSIAVIGRVLEIAHRVDRNRQAVVAAHGSDLATLDVMTTLRRSGAPYELGVGELQRASLVTTGAITQRLDKIERARLVRRRVEPSDRRRVLVKLTADGHRLVDVLLVAVMDSERRLLAAFSTEEQDLLQALLRRWTVALTSGDTSRPMP